MKVEIFPLLEKQRELYRIPRGMERFHSYLREMIDPQSRDLRLPLSAMNPMGKDHIPALLDQLITLGAERAAAQAIAEAAQRLRDIPGDYRLALVLSDDAMGGWIFRFYAAGAAGPGGVCPGPAGCHPLITRRYGASLKETFFGGLPSPR